MEREIEVKILDINVRDFENKLKLLGADFVKRENQKNMTINSSKHPIPKDKGYFRIRISESNGEIKKYFTFKENISTDGVRDNLEHTIEFDDEDELLKILDLLEYDEINIGTKERIKYTYEGLIIDIDTWDKNTYPNPYVEVEGKSIEGIYNFIDKLKIDRKNISTLSIAELQENLKK